MATKQSKAIREKETFRTEKKEVPQPTNEMILLGTTTSTSIFGIMTSVKQISRSDRFQRKKSLGV